MTRLFWMALQAASTAGGLWIGLNEPVTDTPRVILVPLMTVIGFFFGLALTVVWVLIYELFRYRLPALARRGAEQIQRRRALGG